MERSAPRAQNPPPSTLETLYTIDDLVATYKISKRWLQQQCRDSKVEHTLVARRRLFTGAQAAAVVAAHTVHVEQSTARSGRERSLAALRRGRGRS